MRRSTALTLGCMALTSALVSPFALSQHNVHAIIISPALRKPAPAFSLTDASGKTMQVPDYHGKVVLLNFWATECGGCKIEIPGFIDLQQAYKDKGFTVVGISADITYSNLKNPEQGWNQVKPFVSSHNLNYPVLMADDAVLTAYSATTLPASFLIDKTGKIAATYVGVVDKSDVEANIRTLLAEQ